MKRLFWMFVGLLVGGGAVYGGFHYHLVNSSNGFELVPKRSATFADAYVDVREFTMADWADHQDLAANIVAAKKSHLMVDGAAVESSLRGLVDGLTR